MDLMKSAAWIFVLGIGGTIAATAVPPEQPQSSASVAKAPVRQSSLLDYLVKDVCVNSTHQVLSGDPS